MNKTLSPAFIILLFLLVPQNKVSSQNIQPDVTCYHLTIEPDIEKKLIKGSVAIDFRVNENSDSVIFQSGNLEIKKVSGDNIAGYKKINKDLIIYLKRKDCKETEIVIDYQGNPKKGLIFEPENNQAYTMYFTSDWMICNDSPNDKALIYIDLITPVDKTCIASGEETDIVQQNNKMLHKFRQNTESPAYTYGFAIGNFNKVEKKYNKILLKYYSPDYSVDQITAVFKETPAMISFFEDKSGVNYFQSTYSQILAGKFYQEMSGFSMLKTIYGDMVLQDSTETNLISHELAHQWWGNMITCRNWNHFWLNEGMATFMSAAYNEYRFGRKVYLSDIDSYYKVYEDIKNRGNDRSLIFSDWLNPSKDDRNVVYFKGAYVMHLLKEKLGDEVFWNAIRFYSKKYFGKSVETIDFQKALEESSGIKLDDFFNEWVY